MISRVWKQITILKKVKTLWTLTAKFLKKMIRVIHVYLLKIRKKRGHVVDIKKREIYKT